MAQRTDVMISSTALDLPEHRKAVSDAILRMDMHPIGMESLTAMNADAIDVSLAMVDEAEIYLGVFARRYGYMPISPKNPDKLSITEMEYRRAVERDIPRLIFLVGDDHPITAKDLETNPDGAAKLLRLKEELGTTRVVQFFNSVDQLREQVVSSLAKLRKPRDPAAPVSMHYVSDIPQPPEAYIAHPYTLMHASRLFGRQPELNLLTDWVAKPSSPAYQARIMNIVAIGGMGKSALTWKWFNEIAPHEMKPLAGRMWWSFYESDAHFENFIIRALAYVTGKNHEDVRRDTKPGEREDMLFRELDQKPFLLVLDGLERILIAYARMDAARLSDDDYDKQTANYIAGAAGLPAGAGKQFVGQVQLRKTADPRAGQFLRRLAGVRASRILVSTRLYPTELQSVTGYPIPGSYARFLTGLHDDDALNLWRDLGVSGGRDELLRVFRRFDNYPLLIRALAGEVARFRRAPGNFDAWRETNPDFTRILANLRQEDAKSHVLSYALKDLAADRRAVLTTLAAFRAPAGYATLVALMVGEDSPLQDGEGPGVRSDSKPFATESDLDAALDELEQRGLIGWDRRANRYDLHPIVRGVTWGNVADDDRRNVYEALRGHFESVPQIDDWEQVNTLEDLTPAIELYQALINLGRYNDACDLFYARIEDAARFRLSANRQRAELLEMLFPDPISVWSNYDVPTTQTNAFLPLLTKPDDQAWTLNALAMAYNGSGQPGRAALLYHRQIAIRKEQNVMQSVAIAFSNLSDTLWLDGSLCGAETAARRALVIAREHAEQLLEAVNLYWWGLVLATRGADFTMTEAALRRSTRLFMKENEQQSEGTTNAFFAQGMLWRGHFAAARELAERAWEMAHVHRVEADFILSARVQGEAALGLRDFETASERLYHALIRARAVNRVEEELPALVALAELARQRNNPDEARRLLDDVWEAAERGPYPLFHADALNVLAQLERDAGNHDTAVAVARKAYEKAWCDGPPFAYHWGLEKAKAHLDALGAPYPDMPPFDESKYDPMPEVEIYLPEDGNSAEG